VAHDDGDYGLVPRIGWIRWNLFGWTSPWELRPRLRECGTTIEIATATVDSPGGCERMTGHDQYAEWPVQVYGIHGTDAPQQ
jgi:hypothetical protein